MAEYGLLLWPALWRMWHPRLPSNPFRYSLNVVGLLGMAVMGSGPPYAVLYLVIGQPFW